MAFGFPPKFYQEYKPESLNNEHLLLCAVEAARNLDWNISFVSETGFVAYTKFSLSSWSEEVTVKIGDNAAQITSKCSGAQILDWGKNRSNVEALISETKAVRDALTEDETEIKISDLRESYISKENDTSNISYLDKEAKAEGFLSMLKPSKGYFITPILININLLVFILMIISGVNFIIPENQDLLNWGANFRPMTLDGQWWRLFTSCFIHIGIMHLLLNMYALLYIGTLLEPYLGKTRFIVAYLISGVAASVISLWWQDFTISAGASGAIFGMYGVFLALLSTNLIEKSARKSLMTSIAVFVGYNILYGLKENSGIDNAAHIGGLLSGVIIGYSYILSLKNHNNKIVKYSTSLVLVIVLIFFSLKVYKELPNDYSEYDEKMKEFVSIESKALEVYNLPKETPPYKLIKEIKDNGLRYWNENLKLVESFKELDLPQVIITRNSKLKEYCELRIKIYNLICKALEEGTDNYDNEINEYNKKIDSIIKELGGEQM